MRLDQGVRQVRGPPAPRLVSLPHSQPVPIKPTSTPSPPPRNPNYNIKTLKNENASDDDDKKNFIAAFGELSINRNEVEAKSSSDENDDSDSDDEKEIDEDFVAKCPDLEDKTIKKVRKNSQPYQTNQRRLHCHRNIGSNENSFNEVRSNNLSINNLVASYPHTCPDDMAIQTFLKNVSEDQVETLYKMIDKVNCDTQSSVTPTTPVQFNSWNGLGSGNHSGEESEDSHSFDPPPGSIDSAYFTNSPGSSITQSPQQRQRILSESEASPPYEIPASHYNIPLPTENVSIRQDGVAVHEKDMDIKAEDRIEKKLNKEVLAIQWISVHLDTNFSSIDKNGNTKLMEHLINFGMKNRGFLEKLSVMISIIKKLNRLDLLLKRNNLNESALSYSVIHLHSDPRVPRLILDTLVDLNKSLENEIDDEGNGLLHILAKLGDSHVHVMAEFLNAKNSEGAKVFRIDALNKSHNTPLHVAIKSHSIHTPTISTVKLLVKHGADVKLMDSRGQSPLHLAVNGSCDPRLVKSILQTPLEVLITNITDPKGDSPLHCVARRDDIPLFSQKEVIRKLISSGAKSSMNLNGKVPWSLVPTERRNELKDVFKK